MCKRRETRADIEKVLRNTISSTTDAQDWHADWHVNPAHGRQSGNSLNSEEPGELVDRASLMKFLYKD